MPGGNGTGPMGQGPMTGRGAGFCAGFAVPGFANRGQGRGFGMGRGFGRGTGRGMRGAWGWGGYAPMPAAAPTPREEADVLSAQVEQLSATLKTLQDRLAQLRAAKDKAE